MVYGETAQRRGRTLDRHQKWMAINIVRFFWRRLPGADREPLHKINYLNRLTNPEPALFWTVLHEF
mgnify:CR=1 FL=1